MKQYGRLYFAFLRLGAFTFGGGLAMLPLLQHEVVERYGWATEEELIDMYAVAQCAPGIIAVNTAVYVGSHVAGVPGSLAAVLGQITSPICLISCIAFAFQHLTEQPLFQHALAGIRAMVCVLLCNTAWRMGQKSLVDIPTVMLCAAGVILSLLLHVPLIAVMLGAGLLGLLLKGGKPS